MIYILIFIYIYSGIAYLSGLIEAEKISVELNELGEKLTSDLPPLSTPIKDNGWVLKIIIICIWPLVAVISILSTMRT